MHITDSELTLTNQHQETSRHHRTEWVVARTPALSSQEDVQVAISQLAASLQRSSVSGSESRTSDTLTSQSKDQQDVLDEESLPPKYRAMKRMIELLTGEKLDLSLQRKLQRLQDAPSTDQVAHTNPQQAGTRDHNTDTQEWVWVHERIEWSQHNSFTAEGRLNLAGGDSIAFSLNVDFGQMRISETSELVTREQLKDPLVLSLDGGPVRLLEGEHGFDLDVDGTTDRLPFLAPRQAYLAWDQNQDGTINNGNELFGARTNNGFAELAELDDDGNRFIDAGDKAYDQLQLWFKGDDQDRLMSLQNAGVAAIGLTSTATPYRLLDPDDQQRGVIRESGVFINNQGQGGLVQQIDLKI